ncbi:MAG: hypothetical protein WD003_00395 [Candidatus Paceibacterota bacterium]
MEQSLLAQLVRGEIFEPTFLNLGYLYNLILNGILDLLRLIFSPLLLIGPLQDDFWRVVFWIISLLLFLALLWVFFKYHELRRAEDEKYEELLESTSREVSETRRSARWGKVMDHLDSLHEADWRLGILEADNMLGEILDSMGYVGDTIGEQLQAIEPSDFRTLNQAWEAHKVRNKIAHEGAEFALSKREAQRVTNLFKEVFEEFHYI